MRKLRNRLNKKKLTKHELFSNTITSTCLCFMSFFTIIGIKIIENTTTDIYFLSGMTLLFFSMVLLRLAYDKEITQQQLDKKCYAHLGIKAQRKWGIF